MMTAIMKKVMVKTKNDDDDGADEKADDGGDDGHEPKPTRQIEVGLALTSAGHPEELNITPNKLEAQNQPPPKWSPLCYPD